ncbi:MAG: hypothetical protein R2854_22580 [Caldilineaceae bacterium]
MTPGLTDAPAMLAPSHVALARELAATAGRRRCLPALIHLAGVDDQAGQALATVCRDVGMDSSRWPRPPCLRTPQPGRSWHGCGNGGEVLAGRAAGRVRRVGVKLRGWTTWPGWSL